MTIPTGKAFDDFQKLGFSRNHLVIGANTANLGTGEFEFARIWAIGKPADNDPSCSALPVTSFGSKAAPIRGVDGHVLTTPIPVTPVHPTGNAYVISADCPGDPSPDPREPSSAGIAEATRSPSGTCMGRAARRHSSATEPFE